MLKTMLLSLPRTVINGSQTASGTDRGRIVKDVWSAGTSSGGSQEYS